MWEKKKGKIKKKKKGIWIWFKFKIKRRPSHPFHARPSAGLSPYCVQTTSFNTTPNVFIISLFVVEENAKGGEKRKKGKRCFEERDAKGLYDH